MLDATNIKFIVLGIPTWALVDGTWSMLSQLANHCPEGYAISSYLILCLTIGNLVPLGLGFALKDYSTVATKNIIKMILVIGLVTGILLAFFWNYSVPLANTARRISFPLYALFFVVGACSSSSNVTHFTFVSRYAGINTSALATGMGIGSMLAGLLAIAQGLVLVNHGYSVSYYYLTMALLYVPASFALRLLTKQEMDNPESDSKIVTHAATEETQSILVNIPVIERYSAPTVSSNLLNSYSEKDFLRSHRSVLYVQMFNASLGYGFVPAIISLACSKFNDRTLVLLLSTGITAILDPSFKALTAVHRIKSISGLIISAIFLGVLTIGLLLCAALPANLSMFKGAGGVMPILLYTSFQAIFGYSNTSVYRFFKENVASDCIHHAYRWAGVASQTGALVGSLIAFILVVSTVL